MKNAPICLVEDDDSIRSSLVDLLNYEGYDTIDFPNGRSALDYLATAVEKPGIIFLDLMMPVMNGWEFLKEAPKFSNVRDIPIVVFSAASQGVDNLAPAVAHIRKPLDIDSFLNILKDNLKH